MEIHMGRTFFAARVIAMVAVLVATGCGASAPSHPETDCDAFTSVSTKRQVAIIEPVMSQWVARDGYAPSSSAWLQRAADNTSAVCAGFPVVAAVHLHDPQSLVEVCGRSSPPKYQKPPGPLTVAFAEQCAYMATVLEHFNGPIFGPDS
jgi:hypothetical protein